MYGILSNSLYVTFEKSKVVLVPEVCVWPSFFLSLTVWRGFSCPQQFSELSQWCTLNLNQYWALTIWKLWNFGKFSLLHWWFPLFSLFCFYGSFMVWILDHLDLPLILSFSLMLHLCGLLLYLPREFLIFWNFYWDWKIVSSKLLFSVSVIWSLWR